MTVPSKINRWDYVGNGAANTYAYTKKAFVNTDLVVTVADTDGDETSLVIGVDYTVTGVGEITGGNIVLVNASQAWLTSGFLITDYAITIRRIRPVTQDTDIRNQGDFFPETHEDEFDKQIMIDQQQQDELDRSVKIAVTETGVSTTLPSATADAFIGWNAAATALTNKAPTSLTDSGPTINGGDAAKIINVNSAESAYQLSTFKALLEAIVAGGLTVNTALTAASTLTVTGALAANAALTMGSIFKSKKGADVASTGTMTLGDDGNVFDITGTTGITSIVIKTAGTRALLQFDDVLTVTDGSNLKLQGDFVTAADSVLELFSDGTNWHEISRNPTTANTPSFLGKLNSTQSNIATATLITIITGEEVFDIGSNYVHTTGIFTAPVTGKYQFNAKITMESIDQATTYLMDLVSSNTTISASYNPTQLAADIVSPGQSISISAVLDMDANDTCKVQIIQAAGTQQTDIVGRTDFSGHLIT